MKDLVVAMKGTAVVDSLQVAEHFHKRHGDVLRAIENAISTQPKIALSEKTFIRSHYTDESGKKNPMYYLDRDGFSFVAMGFTGRKAAEWKWRYIQAFNAMEQALQERQTLAWQETRRLGKLARRSETDAIKELVEYAKGQGSKHANMLYTVYSRLANGAAGISCRDSASAKQLNALDDIESMILHVVRLGMAAGKHYKEIYADCKRRLEWWQEVTFQREELKLAHEGTA